MPKNSDINNFLPKEHFAALLKINKKNFVNKKFVDSEFKIRGFDLMSTIYVEKLRNSDYLRMKQN